MNQSSVFTLCLATAVVQQLQPVLDRSCQTCHALSEQVALLITRFLSGPITPVAFLDFEKALRQLLDESGRLIVQSVANHIEPEPPQDAPKHVQRDHQDYARKNQKRAWFRK